MTTFTYQINDPMGFHARPVGFLAKFANSQKAVISIQFNGQSADARRLYQVLGLNIKTNDIMTIQIDGEQEEVIKEQILTLFKDNNL